MMMGAPRHPLCSAETPGICKGAFVFFIGSYMLVSPFFMSAHIVGASFILGQPAGYRRTGWDLPSPVTTSTTRKASMWHMVRRRFWWRSPPSAGDGEGGGEGSAS